MFSIQGNVGILVMQNNIITPLNGQYLATEEFLWLPPERSDYHHYHIQFLVPHRLVVPLLPVSPNMGSHIFNDCLLMYVFLSFTNLQQLVIFFMIVFFFIIITFHYFSFSHILFIFLRLHKFQTRSNQHMKHIVGQLLLDMHACTYLLINTSHKRFQWIFLVIVIIFLLWGRF